MRGTRSYQRAARGFSLVEMLVTITLIGLLAAIAIPEIGSTSDSARRASCQRNAQHVVSVYLAGVSAGIVWAGSSKIEKIASVVQGAAPEQGVLAHHSFRVPDLQGDILTGIYPYIGCDLNGDLFYDMAGEQN